MNALGLDPGLNGALALLDPDAKILDLVDMPTLRLTKSRRAIDAAAVVGILEDWRAFHGPLRATVEQAGCRPGQHAASGLKTGTGYGILLGILAAQKIPHEAIPPKRWQQAVVGRIDRGTAKDQARRKAQELWPEAAAAGMLGQRKTQDRSDALLIALYGLQRWRAAS